MPCGLSSRLSLEKMRIRRGSMGVGGGMVGAAWGTVRETETVVMAMKTWKKRVKQPAI